MLGAAQVWFSGHYGEPPIELEHSLRLQGQGAYTHYLLTLSEGGEYWDVTYPDEEAGLVSRGPGSPAK